MALGRLAGDVLPPWTSRFGGEQFMRVEEFEEDGTLVVRADLPGIDPDKDVEISLADHTLTIEAERREDLEHFGP